jgi:hypothetical protein
MFKQQMDGKHNCKTDLIDVLNFASAVNLPTTGIAGKYILLLILIKIYRCWHDISTFIGAASVSTASCKKTFAASMSVAVLLIFF